MISKPIPLSALSAHQRRIVERNLPLVQLTLRRNSHLIEQGRTGREPTELFQEGSLALIEAIRGHDPGRHGHFAAYAMARIHFAVSRYVHEHQNLIRVPFSTQRRRRKRPSRSRPEDPQLNPLPMIFSLSGQCDQAAPSSSTFYDLDCSEALEESVTLGEMVHERYQRASRRVIREMKNDPRCARGIRHVVERCSEERWNVPEPDARTPIRQLAKSLSCSIGRITHCEERYRKKLANQLDADTSFHALKRIARAHSLGMYHRLSQHERKRLQSALDNDHPSDASKVGSAND